MARIASQKEEENEDSNKKPWVRNKIKMFLCFLRGPLYGFDFQDMVIKNKYM